MYIGGLQLLDYTLDRHRNLSPGKSIEMPAAPTFIEARRLIAEMIYRVGIAIEDSSPAAKRMVARRIIEIEGDLYNFVQFGGDLRRFKLILRNLEQELATFSDDQPDDVGAGPAPYSIEGIAFSVLVHLVRLEECAFYRGWTPKQLRDLGLDLRCDEEITWLDAERVKIRDSSGNVRHRYRCQ